MTNYLNILQFIYFYYLCTKNDHFSIIHAHIKPWVHVYQVKYLFLLGFILTFITYLKDMLTNTGYL